MITPSSFGELTRTGINKIFGDKYSSKERVAPRIFTTFKSKKAFEEFLQVTRLGLLSRRDPLQDAVLEDPNQGYTIRLTPVNYAKGVGIAQEALDDDQYGYLKTRIEMLAEAAAESKENLAATLFNDGFSTAGYDGQAWFSASHVNPVGGTFSNLVDPADLSITLLEAYKLAAADLTDHKGNKIRAKCQTLIIPEEEEWTAWELLKSKMRPDSMNNGDNPAMGFVPYLCWSYLDDPDATFMKLDIPLGAVCIEREPAVTLTDFNASKRAHFAYVNERLVYSYVDPMGFLGCAGA